MKREKRLKYEQNEIEKHLKSAIDQMTPSVLKRIDLTTPQDGGMTPLPIGNLWTKLRPILTMAACFFLLLSVSGIYLYQENKVVSVVGIDVNPSIEFSLNRNQKVLKVEALNQDAKQITSLRELKGQTFDSAVNQVIVSMVEDGYLKGEKDAVLISVITAKAETADKIEELVVRDVKQSLEQNQVQAVVYNQKVTVSNEVEELAKEYNISNGKAYFLKDIIDHNETLTMNSMNQLSALKMDEISEEITAGNYFIKNDDVKKSYNPGESDRIQEIQTEEIFPEEIILDEQTSAILENNKKDIETEVFTQTTQIDKTTEVETSFEQRKDDRSIPAEDEEEETVISKATPAEAVQQNMEQTESQEETIPMIDEQDEWIPEEDSRQNNETHSSASQESIVESSESMHVEQEKETVRIKRNPKNKESSVYAE